MWPWDWVTDLSVDHNHCPLVDPFLANLTLSLQGTPAWAWQKDQENTLPKRHKELPGSGGGSAGHRDMNRPWNEPSLKSPVWVGPELA